MSYSSIEMVPCVGWYRPASSLASVDLPAPLRPRIAWMPPGPICSDTLSSARWPDGYWKLACSRRNTPRGRGSAMRWLSGSSGSSSASCRRAVASLARASERQLLASWAIGPKALPDNRFTAIRLPMLIHCALMAKAPTVMTATENKVSSTWLVSLAFSISPFFSKLSARRACSTSSTRPLRTSSAHHQASTARMTMATTITGSTGQAMMPITIRASRAIGRSSTDEATPPEMHERIAPTSRNSCSHWVAERCSKVNKGWPSIERIRLCETSRSIVAPASRSARARLRRRYSSSASMHSTPATMAVSVAVPPREITRL